MSAWGDNAFNEEFYLTQKTVVQLSLLTHNDILEGCVRVQAPLGNDSWPWSYATKEEQKKYGIP